MSTTMKAAVVHEFGAPLIIEQVERPKVRDGMVLVKVEACGVCHTDLHAVDGDWPVKPQPPFIPGHEGVGIVCEVGKGVTAVKEGDRVGVPWLFSACGHCRYCMSGWETLCDNQQNAGYSVNGSFAEYVLADPDYVGKIPDGLDSAAVAPILCAGVTVYKGLKETDTKPGDTVVISGIGGLGHLAVQYAKAMGLTVVAVDVSDEKLVLATKMGADFVINASKQNPVEEVHKAVGGADGVLVTAVSRSAFSQAVGMLAKHGTLSLVGLPPGDFDLNIFDTVLNRKTVRGSIVGTRMDLVESLEFAAAGKVKTHYTVDSLDNINQVFDKMRDGKIDGRIVLTM